VKECVALWWLGRKNGGGEKKKKRRMRGQLHWQAKEAQIHGLVGGESPQKSIRKR